VFDNLDDVAKAIEQLRRAGFRRSEIKVVSSGEDAIERFAQYVDQLPSGRRTSGALSRAAWLYAALAVAGIVVGLATSPATALIVTTALLGVALLATFGSIMLTRGAEQELSNYYAQGVIPGQVLLAVDLEDNAPREKIAAADRVFERFTGSHAALDRE
jgi:hypothetical protein